jgi:holin-like protein
MLLLFAALAVKGSAPAGLRAGAHGILRHLSLLFVPAGTGILVHFSRVADEWPAILLALAGSTALAIGVTALTMQALMRGRSRRTGAR